MINNRLYITLIILVLKKIVQITKEIIFLIQSKNKVLSVLMNIWNN